MTPGMKEILNKLQLLLVSFNGPNKNIPLSPL